MQASIEISEKEITEAVRTYIQERTGISLEFELVVETKSKQNYRSEWEAAAFRGVVKFIG